MAEWQLDPPFVEAIRHVHTPLCGDHPRVVAGIDNSDESMAVANLLKVARDAPLLRIRQLIYSTKGIATLYVLGLYRSDRHTLLVRRFR